MVGWCHHHLGFVAVEERDFERARREFERAVEFARGKDSDWLRRTPWVASPPWPSATR